MQIIGNTLEKLLRIMSFRQMHIETTRCYSIPTGRPKTKNQIFISVVDWCVKILNPVADGLSKVV